MNGAKSRRSGRFRLSLVAPMYNEGEVCDLFFERTLPILEAITPDFEIICVDDGSKDDTVPRLHAAHRRDKRIKVIAFSRNFGKEVALTAGIERATGDAVIPIDADLQDPPELIADLVEKWREGYDSVLAVRTDRSSDGYLKRTTANLFYRVIGRMSDVPIPANAGDFRLLDRVVVEALRAMPERNRFMKGLYAWAGFRTATVGYVRPARVAGTTKLRFWKLWNLALEGILSFSTLPLRMWSYVGLAVAAMAGVYGIVIVVRTLIHGVDVPGYASLLAAILFLSGINMIGLGILGEYVGRIFLEVKRRPLYLIGSTLGFDDRPVSVKVPADAV